MLIEPSFQEYSDYCFSYERNFRVIFCIEYYKNQDLPVKHKYIECRRHIEISSFKIL